jgi:methylated-DNA-[protein]-cysteine S-methyltransferase
MNHPTALPLLMDTVSSPLGDIVLVATDRALVGLSFADCPSRWWQQRSQPNSNYSIVPTANPLGMSDRLNAYFAGDCTVWDEVTIAADGTPFQQRVWNQLRQISAGQTMTYGDLAQSLGDVKAVRAVATANAQNPVAIAIPCHRVIGKDGSLTGYAGGLERKRWLLVHETALLA